MSARAWQKGVPNGCPGGGRRRPNIRPGLVVQALMFAVLVGYFVFPPFRQGLENLARTKEEWGYLYSGLAGVVAGALLPELLRVAVFQKGRPARQNILNLLFTMPFWGMMATFVDIFYRAQAQWFGDEATFEIVFKQVAVDQLVYTPFFSTPLTVWLYDWRNRGYTWPKDFYTRSYCMDRILPTLLANWVVWIPIVVVLYSLPEAVQIPLFALALSLWVIIYTWMSEEGRS